MTEFDLRELRAVFEVGRIPVNHDDLARLERLLQVLAQQYRAHKVAREQDLKRQLGRLEEIKNLLPALWDTELLLYAFEAEISQIIQRLSGAIQHGIDFVRNEREQRKVRGDDPETRLFMDLRDVYVGLSGRTGISEDGLLHRFANACAKLIDPDIVLPQAQSLRKALKRRAKVPPYFELRQKDLKGIR